MDYGTPKVIRGKSNSTILRNVAILQERYPRQSIKQDMAISLNVAGLTRSQREQQPKKGR
jgi:hypothetical protein